MKRRLRLLKRTCGTLKLCLIALATLFVLNAIYLTNQRYRFDSTQFDPIKFVNVEQLQHSNDIQASIRTDAFAVHLHQQLIRIQRLLCGRHRRLNFSTHVRFAYSLATSDLPKSWFPSKQLFRPPVDCNASIDRQPISVRWVFEQIAKTSDPIDWTIATRHQILIKLVELLNKFPPILNADKVINGNKSDMIENRRPIILIQVHNRSNYLAQTIHSLSAVQGIDRALLIFSHDVFSVPINRLVQNIQFAATVQIFFPFSNQIYFNQFPGPSPNDCPRNHPIQRYVHHRSN